MLIKRQLLFFFCILIFLIPKVYYLTLAYNNDNYSETKIYGSADEAHYLSIAKNISDYGVYSDNNSNVPTERATWRPPIWPLILASFLNLTNNLFFLILLKFILELGLILLAVFCLRKYSRHKLYYIFPFLLLLLEPQYLKYSLTFLSESISAVFILLLVVCFVLFVKSKKYSICIILLALLVILCHPVSAFFVAVLLLFYGVVNLKTQFLRVSLHAVLFVSMFLIWPIRNALTFQQGAYLTTSQGTTFSKGWNRDVSLQFNNCDGDLANESLNLKFLKKDDALITNLNYIEASKQYTKATLFFLSSISFSEKIEIALSKLKSNFNPFPEKEKNIFLEKISVVFRVLYLFALIQALYFLLFKNNKRICFYTYKASLVVVAIYLGQIFMSVYIYTGLRFNSIYGLALLFLLITINYNLIVKILNAISVKLKIKNL